MKISQSKSPRKSPPRSPSRSLSRLPSRSLVVKSPRASPNGRRPTNFPLQKTIDQPLIIPVQNNNKEKEIRDLKNQIRALENKIMKLNQELLKCME